MGFDQAFIMAATSDRYYALHQPHVPRLPGPRFRGATALGPRGDVIVEMDACVGGLIETLGRLGLEENTFVIFSSDNGPVPDDGYRDRAEELAGDHRPAGPLRGGKYSLFDGGTRVPFLVSWPGTVNPGDSDALVSHVDFHASFRRPCGAAARRERSARQPRCPGRPARTQRRGERTRRLS